MRYLLNCIAYLCLCLIITKLININTSQKIKLTKANEQIKQLDDAVKLIGIGGEGQTTNRKVNIQNILNNRGADFQYGWRFSELTFPLKKETTYITSEYNDIRYDSFGEYYFKIKSTDLKCVDDDRVIASITGTCKIEIDNVYGNRLTIMNNEGWIIKYGHLESFNVIDGQEIKQGDIVGVVGNTGHCRIYDYRLRTWRDITEYERESGYGKHLDYEIQKNEVYKNAFTNSLYGNEL